MRLNEMIKSLQQWDREGVYLFSKADLGKIFNEQGRRLTSSLSRATEAGLLERVARGLYLNANSSHIGGYTVEDIASRLRRGEFCYVSLESAASQWGVISQIPVGRLTVMTTGREGEFRTRFGAIEFVHTDANFEELEANTIDWPGRPLRFASKQRTVRDLLACRRSLDLIDWEEVNEDAD